jgi:hypothetical protein
MMTHIISRRVQIILVIALSASYVLATDRLVPSAYSTISRAISSATNGDVIIISPGTYSGYDNSKIYISSKSITIRSKNPEDPNVVASTIIDGFDSTAGNNPAFNLSYASIVIEGITIASCYDTYGGAIKTMDSSLTLRNCVFEDCIAWNDGGTINARNSKIVLDNCQIIGSTAQSRGGAIYAEYKSNIELINCDFIDNWSMSSGGALYVSDSNLSVTGCQFTENTTLGSSSGLNGGAIYIGSTAANKTNVLITRSDFIDNFASGNGGAIYILNKPLDIKQSSFIGNISQQRGGAISYDSNMVLLNSVLAGNIASTGGAAIDSNKLQILML